ncbi:GNAT superfamily N-acetyltransferase [Saccharothrix tamanrassetensis]|uniref:GNAT superfamily N-acetyltransferase n=1 Tax=Saccharothrix tamanrassetensis TaxID=1051531 RepID=A0A841CHU6_9PSEU|nr:GNAT family N-acetyltransferase [Saccharothrix tamanrassetensis]MBB5956971.1 GNAT superfamily N-acetyltransferase [Saccharothrix tamanrassetensis]
MTVNTLLPGTVPVVEMSIEPATPADVPDVLRLRGDAEEWLALRNIDQWRPGWLSFSKVSEQIDDGQWYVARDGDAVRGAFRLLWSDEPVWRADNAFAAYVHGLVTDRRCAGAGLGARILAWVAEHGREAGATRVRLDCVAHNRQLRRYYAGLGFREVGRRRFDGGWVHVLLEKSTDLGC